MPSGCDSRPREGVIQGPEWGAEGAHSGWVTGLGRGTAGAKAAKGEGGQGDRREP